MKKFIVPEFGADLSGGVIRGSFTVIANMN